MPAKGGGGAMAQDYSQEHIDGKIKKRNKGMKHALSPSAADRDHGLFPTRDHPIESVEGATALPDEAPVPADHADAPTEEFGTSQQVVHASAAAEHVKENAVNHADTPKLDKATVVPHLPATVGQPMHSAAPDTTPRPPRADSPFILVEYDKDGQHLTESIDPIVSLFDMRKQNLAKQRQDLTLQRVQFCARIEERRLQVQLFLLARHGGGALLEGDDGVPTPNVPAAAATAESKVNAHQGDMAYPSACGNRAEEKQRASPPPVDQSSSGAAATASTSRGDADATRSPEHLCGQRSSSSSTKSGSDHTEAIAEGSASASAAVSPEEPTSTEPVPAASREQSPSPMAGGGRADGDKREDHGGETAVAWDEKSDEDDPEFAQRRENLEWLTHQAEVAIAGENAHSRGEMDREASCALMSMTDGDDDEPNGRTVEGDGGSGKAARAAAPIGPAWSVGKSDAAPPPLLSSPIALGKWKWDERVAHASHEHHPEVTPVESSEKHSTDHATSVTVVENSQSSEVEMPPWCFDETLSFSQKLALANKIGLDEEWQLCAKEQELIAQEQSLRAEWEQFQKSKHLSGMCYWQSNEGVKRCPRCAREFSFTVRKHHCRRCGILLCNNCCQNIGRDMHGPEFDRSQHPSQLPWSAQPVLPTSSYSVEDLEDMPLQIDLPQRTAEDAPSKEVDARANRQRSAPWCRICNRCYLQCLYARKEKNYSVILQDGRRQFYVLSEKEQKITNYNASWGARRAQMNVMKHLFMENCAETARGGLRYVTDVLVTSAFQWGQEKMQGFQSILAAHPWTTQSLQKVAPPK